MSLGEVVQKIRVAKSLIVAAHISPDGDAVGSSFGLTRILRSMGKSAQAYLCDGVPERMKPLISDTPWSSNPPVGSYDLLIAIDTATKMRLGPDVEELFKHAASSVVIDHHVSNAGYGDVNFIQGDAPSSASLVIELAAALGVVPDKAAVNLLFAGLCDDTGSFRFSNAGVRAFSDASELVRMGAEPEPVAQALYFSDPFRQFKLRSRALESLELVLKNRIALISLSRATLEELGCTSEDTGEVVDEARRVAGTSGAVFLREVENGWKASLRSKGDAFDANAVARTFGGGGHRAAAGCTIQEPLEKAKELLLAALEKALGS